MYVYSLGKIVDSTTSEYLGINFEIKEFSPFLVEPGSFWSNLKSEFPKFGIGKGASGCLYGHLSIWKSFVETATQDEYALVLESDAEITRYGKKYLSQVLESFSKSDRNVLHLGSHETIKKYLSPKLTISTSNSDIILDFASSSLLKLWSPIFRRNFFYFSTHAYLISYRFASFLVRGAPPPLIPIDVYLQSLSQSRNNLIDSTLQALFRQSKSTHSLVNQLGR